MKTIRILLALLAILLSDVTVNAKLTIAYESAPNNKFDVNIQTVAKIRQAMIEIYGEEWFKYYIKLRVLNPKWQLLRQARLTSCIGQKNELILQGHDLWDEELLMKVKDAYDLLASRGDTLYLSSLYFSNKKDSGVTLSEALNRAAVNRLLVGNLHGKEVNLLDLEFGLLANDLEEEYEKECEENGFLPWRVIAESRLEDIRKEDLDFFFKSLMKADKELLKRKITSKPIISKFSYECDKQAEVHYVHEEKTFKFL